MTLTERYQMFIAGEWRDAETGETTDVINAATDGRVTAPRQTGSGVAH